MRSALLVVLLVVGAHAEAADEVVSLHRATGVARFVRAAPGSQQDLAPSIEGTPEDKAWAYLRKEGRRFGIREPGLELRLGQRRVDPAGGVRLSFDQVYQGLPVVGGILHAHFDRAGRLRAVNGLFVPEIDVPTRPRITARRAGDVALAWAKRRGDPTPDPGRVRVVSSGLVVFRQGLVQGVPGPSRLAYHVEVSDDGSFRSEIFVDALTGRHLDDYSLAHDILFRRTYDGAGSPTAPGPNYPGNPFWSEGQTFPTGNAEADEVILTTGEIYGLFENGFNYDSGGLYPFFPATAGEMHAIFDAGWFPFPNASWNGVYTAFSPGWGVDDSTAHEWTHGFTQFTSNLFYRWQSGALNESYSDVFGETVDLTNGRGLDLPNTPRFDCSTAKGFPPPRFTINSPPPIAGDKPAAPSLWTTAPTTVTANLTLADDGVGPLTSDGCEPFTIPSGNVALVDRGACSFAQQADNSFSAGAAAMVVVNDVPDLLDPIFGAPAHPIPSVVILPSDGSAIKGALPGGPVNATVFLRPGTDPSLRWLIIEGVAIPTGREMWNPNCFGNPAKVSDAFYYCGTADNGGVHYNSGVPNHMYALLVDGATYNGRTISPIGFTKAAHLWFRAGSQYLTRTSDFADMADSLEQSCQDLLGVDLQDLQTGGPSGQVLSPGDCGQVAEAIEAVELRLAPAQCNFQPLLDQNPPPLCPAGQVPVSSFFGDFESNPFPPWTVSRIEVTPSDFTDRDWVWTASLPEGRPGSALFAVDPLYGTCAPGGDESGVLQATSPPLAVPSGGRISFDHYVATEPAYDGGNLEISVNGGPFTLLPPNVFTFNAYTGNLAPAPVNTDPLAGQPAFNGVDEGSDNGSWGTSRIDLAGIAGAGDTVQLRFDLGTDGCGGREGWYVDDLNLYSCQSPGGGSSALSIGDATVVEGNSGFSSATFTVSLSPADPSGPVAVDVGAQDGTATAADLDFSPLFATLTFLPGETTRTVAVQVRGDLGFEADESFLVALGNPVGASIGDGLGLGIILNDDEPLAVDTQDELAHGSAETRDLDSVSRWWRIAQKPRSSYELVLDATTGDIAGAGGGPDLQRVGSDGSTVLQSAGPAASGASRSLRFENATANTVANEFIQVRSASCGVDCDPLDTFRIRAYDTTYRIARFNNSATQVTLLVLSNPTGETVKGNAWLWRSTDGALVGSQAFTLQAKQALVVDTSSLAPGEVGAITVSSDAPYGALGGKAVALEPATGFTFDTPLAPRPVP